MATKLMKISEWRDKRFTLDSRPSTKQIRIWCKNGIIPCKRIAGTWFIDSAAEFFETGNSLVDSVLQD
jgi:hypothetical protein